MIKGAAYYDGSDVEIQIGQEVYWLYDENEVRGELVDLNERKFSVRWGDCDGVYDYLIEDIAMIRPC